MVVMLPLLLLLLRLRLRLRLRLLLLPISRPSRLPATFIGAGRSIPLTSLVPRRLLCPCCSWSQSARRAMRATPMRQSATSPEPWRREQRLGWWKALRGRTDLRCRATMQHGSCCCRCCCAGLGPAAGRHRCGRRLFAALVLRWGCGWAGLGSAKLGRAGAGAGATATLSVRS